MNKTAAAAGIRAEQVGPAWRLEIVGPTGRSLRRAELLALPQHTAALPIACVEGWSTEDQQWTGVRLRDLAALAGLNRPRSRAGRQATGEWFGASTEEVSERAA